MNADGTGARELGAGPDIHYIAWPVWSNDGTPAPAGPDRPVAGQCPGLCRHRHPGRHARRDRPRHHHRGRRHDRVGTGRLGAADGPERRRIRLPRNATAAERPTPVPRPRWRAVDRGPLGQQLLPELAAESELTWSGIESGPHRSDHQGADHASHLHHGPGWAAAHDGRHGRSRREVSTQRRSIDHDARAQPELHLGLLRSGRRDHLSRETGVDGLYNEPFGLVCDGQEVWVSGVGYEQMTRWHDSEGRATKTIVHLVTRVIGSPCRRRVTARPSPPGDTGMPLHIRRAGRPDHTRSHRARRQFRGEGSRRQGHPARRRSGRVRAWRGLRGDRAQPRATRPVRGLARI